ESYTEEDRIGPDGWGVAGRRIGALDLSPCWPHKAESKVSADLDLLAWSENDPCPTNQSLSVSWGTVGVIRLPRFHDNGPWTPQPGSRLNGGLFRWHGSTGKAGYHMRVAAHLQHRCRCPMTQPMVGCAEPQGSLPVLETGAEG